MPSHRMPIHFQKTGSSRKRREHAVHHGGWPVTQLDDEQAMRCLRSAASIDPAWVCRLGDDIRCAESLPFPKSYVRFRGSSLRNSNHGMPELDRCLVDVKSRELIARHGRRAKDGRDTFLAVYTRSAPHPPRPFSPVKARGRRGAKRLWVFSIRRINRYFCRVYFSMNSTTGVGSSSPCGWWPTPGLWMTSKTPPNSL